MKKLLIISSLVPLLLTSCGKSEEMKTVDMSAPQKQEVTVPVITETQPLVITSSGTIDNEKPNTQTTSGTTEKSSVRIVSGGGGKWSLTSIYIDGIYFQVPSDYSVDTDRTDALVSIWGMKKDEMNLFGLTVYEEKTSFKTFEEYLQDMKINFIRKFIKENIQNVTEATIDSELEKLKDQYSFGSKEINWIRVVIHKRDFYGMIGKIYDMYVFLGNGKIVHFASETDYPEVTDQIYSSIKKDTSQEWIATPDLFLDKEIKDILAKLDESKSQSELILQNRELLAQWENSVKYIASKDGKTDNIEIVSWKGKGKILELSDINDYNKTSYKYDQKLCSEVDAPQCFNADFKWFVSFYGNGQHISYIWNSYAGNSHTLLNLESGNIFPLGDYKCASNPRFIACLYSLWDGEIRLINLETGKESLLGKNTVSIHMDSKFLYSQEGEYLKIYDLVTYKEVFTKKL